MIHYEYIQAWLWLGVSALGLKWKLSGWFEWLDLLIVPLGLAAFIPVVFVFGDNLKKYSDVKLF